MKVTVATDRSPRYPQALKIGEMSAEVELFASRFVRWVYGGKPDLYICSLLEDDGIGMMTRSQHHDGFILYIINREIARKRTLLEVSLYTGLILDTSMEDHFEDAVRAVSAGQPFIDRHLQDSFKPLPRRS